MMGFDYKCGCRLSGGHWFLCDKHEDKLMEDLEEVEEEPVTKKIVGEMADGNKINEWT
jgi:hypothetical protein